VSVLDREMVIGRRDEDHPLTEPLTIARRPAREPSRPPEDVSEHAGAARRDVEHDADRRPQIRGQALDHPGEHFDATGRGADHHQIAMPV